MANTSRIIQHDRFDGKGFTNENSLANALLTQPDTIVPVITHLAGREDLKFPLTFMSEGQVNGVRHLELNDIQYDWKTFKRLRKADTIYSTPYGAGDKPGINFSPVEVTFATDWIKNQHTVHTPSGTQLRTQGRPTPVAGNRWKYMFQIIGSDPMEYVPLEDLAVGAKWSMVGGANVSESYSKGNESNIVTPGKIKNQLSILRKSYHIGGNIKNRTVECEFIINGKKTNYWMPFEEWQHMINWKQDNEEHLWWSKYNRLPDGSIMNKDPDTGLPIPFGAGVDDQIPNRDTYSELTFKKIKTTVGDVFTGATDTGAMDIILYTGEGGAEEFDTAMKDKASGFSQITGDKFVTGQGRHLSLGGYFTQFQHVDGHVVTIKKLPLLDLGGRAENAPRHPVTGKPMTSYEMYFVDQSQYEGLPNLQMVTQRGRGMIRGIVAGMAPNPYEWTGNNQQIATDEDKFSVHFLATKGICIRRNTHCFKLTCVRS